MSEAWQGGKGDRPRPSNSALFDAGWTMTFGKTLAIRTEARGRWLMILDKLRRKDRHAPK